jgi:hypothetical protein
MVYAGPIFYSAEHDAELLRLYRDWAADAPDGVTALLNLTTAPPLPVIPEAWHGRKVSAFIAVSTDIAEDAEGYVQALRATAGPVADLPGPMPYTVIQSLVDPLWEKGIHAYFKSANLARLDDELVDRLCELDLAAPGPQCEIHVHQMGGAVARVAEDATVYAERSMPFVLNAVAGWRDPALGRARRLGADGDRRRLGRLHRACLRQLPRRLGCRPLVLRRGHLRAARRIEERVRPDEPLQAEPEHRARTLRERFRTFPRTARTSAARTAAASAAIRRRRRGGCP